jgi:hypothetical protein
MQFMQIAGKRGLGYSKAAPPQLAPQLVLALNERVTH